MGMKVGLVPAHVIQVQGVETGSPAELSCPVGWPHFQLGVMLGLLSPTQLLYLTDMLNSCDGFLSLFVLLTFTRSCGNVSPNIIMCG